MPSQLISVESGDVTEQRHRTIPREGVVSLDRSTRDILMGTALGDGYLEPHGKGVRLQVVHSVRYRSYVEWKWKQLQVIGCSPIHYCSAAYPFWRFVTKIHPYLSELRAVFYRHGKKSVPENIGELLRTPLTLAVWFTEARQLSQLVSPWVVTDLRYKLIITPVTTEDASPR